VCWGSLRAGDAAAQLNSKFGGWGPLVFGSQIESQGNGGLCIPLR